MSLWPAPPEEAPLSRPAPIPLWSPLWLALSLAACQAGTTDEGIDTDADTDLPVSDVCTKKGLPVAPFVTEGASATLGGIAGDFTVKTLGGDYTFSQAYTGCYTYLFFVHEPGRSDDLFASDLVPLFADTTNTVEIFFLSDEDGRQGRNDFLAALDVRIDEALEVAIPGVAKRAAFRERIHVVTQRASQLEGSIGAFIGTMWDLSTDESARVDLGDRGVLPVPRMHVFAIDRDQRFDVGGSMSPYVGAPGDEIGMAAFLPHFHDYRHALDTRFATEEGVTTVTVLDELNTSREFIVPAALPDAGTMAGFDTLEIDVTVDCREVNPFACSEWDRIANIQLCLDGEACTARQELARWITPYWRRGRQRYALNASPMLALLRDGGAPYLHIALGPSWERATPWYTNVTLRLSDRGGPRAIAAVPAFGGGNFEAAYNDREPVAFTPPAGTTRAEVVALISGHGQTSGDNCAEWCDHRHAFSVDGTDLDTIAHEGPNIGFGTGCAELATQGVIPGQWGNWAQSRAYWCPGMAVQPHVLDITSLVTAGTESTVDYQGFFGTGTPRGGNISLSSYVVFYEDP